MLKASQLLKDRRNELEKSLEDVEKATKIKAEYLELIEKGQFKNLPSPSHASGFVKNYAKFLNITENEIMPLFRREFDYQEDFQVLPKSFERKEFPLKSFKLSQTLLVAGIVFVMFLAYILFQYRYAFINPPLTVTSPEDRSVVSTQILKISGKTEPNINVYVNKDLVTVDDSGHFEKNISVFPGNLVLNIEAVNKFGKKTNKKITVIIKNNY